MLLEGAEVDTTIRGATFSSFMQYLTSFPNPDSVARAMCRGPLAQFGCHSISIWTHLDFQELVSIAYDGPDIDIRDRYLRIPLTISAPVTHTFIWSTKVILPVGEVVAQYPALQLDQEIWHQLAKQTNNGDLVQVPVIANGAPIGAYTFLCNRQNEWNLNNIALLDGLSAALSLWMSHPHSGALEIPQNAHHAQLALTLRQIEILNLVQLGKSNASISAHLGFSESTIKQELQRVMKRLGVRTREHAVEQCLEMQLIIPTLPPRAKKEK
jgi:DNA-binding CsgD family transcriptional regulator